MFSDMKKNECKMTKGRLFALSAVHCNEYTANQHAVLLRRKAAR
jgi:hypothetical protein